MSRIAVGVWSIVGMAGGYELGHASILACQKIFANYLTLRLTRADIVYIFRTWQPRWQPGNLQKDKTMKSVSELLATATVDAEQTWAVIGTRDNSRLMHYMPSCEDARQLVQQLLDSGYDHARLLRVAAQRRSPAMVRSVTYWGGGRPMVRQDGSLVTGDLFFASSVDPERDSVMRVSESQPGDMPGWLDVETVWSGTPGRQWEGVPVQPFCSA